MIRPIVLLVLFVASSICNAGKPIVCDDKEGYRSNVLSINFGCEQEVRCSVSVVAPLEFEGVPFSGFSLLYNRRGPDEFDLALQIEPVKTDSEVTGFLYGNLDVLERIKVAAYYSAKNGTCPLYGEVQLKHNKSNQQGPSAGTR